MSLAVGVIGAGVMGAEHARLLREDTRGAHLAAVCDADPGRAEAVAQGVAVYADPLALIAAVDAVVIASPDATHADLALACLAAGKPVLCEKPLGVTADDAFRVVQAEVALGKRLVMTAYMRRFDPAYLAMRQARDRIGPAVMLHNIHRNAQAPDWFVGAMPITNSLVHEIDVSRWLLASEFAFARLILGPGGDPMQVILQTASGVIASTEVFMNATYGYHVHAELVGRQGSVAMAQPSLTVENLNSQHGHGYPTNWVPRFAEAYRNQMNAFAHGVRTGSLPGATAWDGYAATAVAEQIVPALHHGQTVTLTLPPRPELYRQALP